MKIKSGGDWIPHINVTSVRSPIIWMGGKRKALMKLLSRIPEHECYCEVFGGGGSLLFAKPPSRVEVYNDIDSTLVDFFRLLQDPNAFKRFHDKLKSTPFSREVYDDFSKTWQNQTDRFERIYRWFVAMRQSFQGKLGSWGYSRVGNSGGSLASRSRTIIDELPEVVYRLRGVGIENDSWEAILDRYDAETTFFYLDPPYFPEKRVTGADYKHELSVDDHRRLLERILTLEGKVLLSGYRNELYDAMLPWQRFDWSVANHATIKSRGSGLHGDGALKGKQKRVESLWLNYEAVHQLELF